MGAPAIGGRRHCFRRGAATAPAHAETVTIAAQTGRALNARGTRFSFAAG